MGYVRMRTSQRLKIEREMELERKKKKEMILRWSRILLCMITIISVSISVFSVVKYNKMEVKLQSDYISCIEKLNKQYADIINTNTRYCSTISTQETVLNDLRGVIQEQDSTIEAVNMKYSSELEELNELRKREELYDKYDFVLYNDMNERTELTYDMIATGEELMINKGLNPDLLMATIAVESTSNPKANNLVTNAAGLGQFLEETGKRIYEKNLGHGEGTYDHNITPYEPSTAIEMIVSYYEELFNKYDGSTYLAIKEYCGGDDFATTEYINKLNNVLAKKGRRIL